MAGWTGGLPDVREIHRQVTQITTEVLMNGKVGIGFTVLLTAALAAGCEHTREGMERDADNAAQASERAADRTAQEAREAGREASQAAERAAEATREAAGGAAEATREGAARAGEAMREGTREAADAGDAAQQTAQIKTALMADSTIDSTTIDVDTNGDTKTVALKGHVRTAAEKTRAAQIAAQKAPGYRIVNSLEVRR